MKILVSTIVLLSSFAFAQVPDATQKAVDQMQKDDVRTILTDVTKKDETPCSPLGTFTAEIQVKKATYNGHDRDVSYAWETVKTYNVDKAGHVLEVCGE